MTREEAIEILKEDAMKRREFSFTLVGESAEIVERIIQAERMAVEVLSEVKEEQCSNCIYFHRLKHNFTREKGFEESYCCDMWLHDPEPGEPWVQEVSPTDMCEMFTPKGEKE